jgi:Uma2 family endonuclease
MAIPEELKLNYEDYLNFPDDGKRHEIIDGEHHMTPSPQTRHQIVLTNISFILINHVRESNLGTVILAPMDVLLSDTTVVQPDLLFIRKDRESIIKKNYIEGSPDLLVEILSPGNEKLDRHTKMKHYALHGVEEYWIIDFEALILEQYLLEGQVYRRSGVFTEHFFPSVFPDLTIQLSEIFKGPGF